MRIIACISFIFLVLIFSGCTVDQPVAGSDTVSPSTLKTPKSVDQRPKIIAFGDSLTAGFGLAEKESYPFLLQQRLNADGFDFEVVNAGVSGDTSLGGLERADWVLAQDNAKILILELGANDLLRGMPVERMKQNLDRIIRKAKARNIEVLLCGMLAPPTMGVQYQRDFVKAFPELAAEHKVEFLPFLLDNVATVKELNQADGIHPNPRGTQIMTENIYAALKPMLSK